MGSELSITLGINRSDLTYPLLRGEGKFILVFVSCFSLNHPVFPRNKKPQPFEKAWVLSGQKSDFTILLACVFDPVGGRLLLSSFSRPSLSSYCRALDRIFSDSVDPAKEPGSRMSPIRRRP